MVYFRCMKTLTKILLIEDNDVDLWLTQAIIQENELPVTLHTVKDGSDAINFLNKVAPFQQAITPDLILLDLQLPAMDGHEVLREIKSNSSLSHIPIVILTSSSHPRDIESTYNDHASAYLNKPLNALELAAIIENQNLFKPSRFNS
jgi:CheY-like chemotaxis protein